MPANSTAGAVWTVEDEPYFAERRDGNSEVHIIHRLIRNMRKLIIGPDQTRSQCGRSEETDQLSVLAAIGIPR